MIKGLRIVAAVASIRRTPGEVGPRLVMREIEEVCDRIQSLHSGKTLVAGTSEKIKERAGMDPFMRRGLVRIGPGAEPGRMGFLEGIIWSTPPPREAWFSG